MEASQKSQFQSKFKRKDVRITTIYSRSLITRNISLPITAVGKNIRETIEDNISSNFEGKCLVEGYIKPGSSKIITYSCGLVERGNFILFEVVFECDVCFPVEGTLISCIAKNITKAGIRAESTESVPSPVVVFIARDHHYNNAQFANIKPDDRFNVRVIGQRFELNDKYVSVIGELVRPKMDFEGAPPMKPKLVIEPEIHI
jgi:DNA-directed RNA polymerase subunit E'/Rpb7